MLCERALRSRELGLRGPSRKDIIRQTLNEVQATDVLAQRACPSCMDVDRQEERYLLVGDTVGSLRAYDLHRTRPRRVAVAKGKTKKNHASAVSSCHWYPHDQGMIITGGSEGCVKLWDSNSMKPVDTIRMDKPVISTDVSSHPNAKPLVAVCCKSSPVRLVNMETGGNLHQIRRHADTPFVVKWSTMHAHMLLTAGCDGAAYAWDVRNCREPVKELRFPTDSSGYGPGPIYGATFSTDHLRLAFIHGSGYISIFDGLSLDFKFGLRDFVENSAGRTNSIHMGFHEDILVVPSTTKIAMIDVQRRDETLLSGHLKPVTCVFLLKSKLDLYSGSADKSIICWNSLSKDVDFVDDDDCWSDLDV